MARKKKKQKPKLKLVKNAPEESAENPPKPTMEDIVYAVDEIILQNDLMTDEGLLRASIRQDLKNACVSPQAEKEEFEIVVDTRARRILYDVKPLEDFMVRSPNLEIKGTVWVVSVQVIDKEMDNPYTLLVFTDNQKGALLVCQGEIAGLFEPYPRSIEKMKIRVRKEFIQLSNDAKIDVKIDFFIEELGVVYRVSSGILFTSD